MRRGILGLAAIALLPILGAATGPVRIGVASSGTAADATISTEAARAPYILLFDENGELVEVVENRGLGARQAGPQVALNLQQQGVTHFIAERFGPNLLRALDRAGIKHVAKTGAANEAVRQLIMELKGASVMHAPL